MLVRSSKDFGALIKKVRTKLQLTQSDVAGACGTGVRFIVDLEHGKPTCELEKVLRVAAILGIKVNTTEPIEDDK